MFVVYGQPGCRWCVSATRLLSDAGHDYEYVDISEDQDAKNFFLSHGHRTVPQVYFEACREVHCHIGGYEDLVNFLQEDTDSKTDVPENGK